MEFSQESRHQHLCMPCPVLNVLRNSLTSVFLVLFSPRFFTFFLMRRRGFLRCNFLAGRLTAGSLLEVFFVFGRRFTGFLSHGRRPFGRARRPANNHWFIPARTLVRR